METYMIKVKRDVVRSERLDQSGVLVLHLFWHHNWIGAIIIGNVHDPASIINQSSIELDPLQLGEYTALTIDRYGPVLERFQLCQMTIFRHQVSERRGRIIARSFSTGRDHVRSFDLEKANNSSILIFLSTIRELLRLGTKTTHH